MGLFTYTFSLYFVKKLSKNYILKYKNYTIHHVNNFSINGDILESYNVGHLTMIQPLSNMLIFRLLKGRTR